MPFLLIHGPFGIGKSTTAQLVSERLPDAGLFDPELVGTFLAQVLGREALGDDYQDMPLWRHLVIDIGLRLQQEWRPLLIIPMNLWRFDYFSEIVSGWGRTGETVIPIRLTCSPETLRRRILSRPTSEGGHAWCLSHLDSGLAAANDPRFGTPIDTEGLDPATVANLVIAAFTSRVDPHASND